MGENADFRSIFRTAIFLTIRLYYADDTKTSRRETGERLDPIAILCGAPAPPCVSSLQEMAAYPRINCFNGFHSPSHLFTYSPSCPYAYKKVHHKPHIFLPHLVASMKVEETYIMIKPDGVQHGLRISTFEKKMIPQERIHRRNRINLNSRPRPQFLTREDTSGRLVLWAISSKEHYKDLQPKPFFPKLIDYITSGPLLCMAWEGVGIVASARKVIGATNSLQVELGTIRGDLAIQTQGRNVVHGSDSAENNKRELDIFYA
ncbi:nucleoside diphosphate kinase 2, chloroplastic-like [Olea europaea var. sylvestris]|uniref:nucleoside diphosphate kinase 2, chloroplastic-like n=1 Tax=Olea europaea var. sylvestris TaxID=158386 RepID=UPI000C1D3D82|nr:nucleoside diphosphate kinase 2, chloroplastic-like [Olea europaea var. sylvestris]